MEAAALYAFSRAREYPVACFAHVTNSMAQIDGDFEKGEAGGALRHARFDFNRCERLATLKVGPTPDIYFSLLILLCHKRVFLTIVLACSMGIAAAAWQARRRCLRLGSRSNWTCGAQAGAARPRGR